MQQSALCWSQQLTLHPHTPSHNSILLMWLPQFLSHSYVAYDSRVIVWAFLRCNTAPVLPLGLKITNAGQSFGLVSKHSGRPPDEGTLFTVTWSIAETKQKRPCHAVGRHLMGHYALCSDTQKYELSWRRETVDKCLPIRPKKEQDKQAERSRKRELERKAIRQTLESGFAYLYSHIQTDQTPDRHTEARKVPKTLFLFPLVKHGFIIRWSLFLLQQKVFFSGYLIWHWCDLKLLFWFRNQNNHGLNV